MGDKHPEPYEGAHRPPERPAAVALPPAPAGAGLLPGLTAEDLPSDAMTYVRLADEHRRRGEKAAAAECLKIAGATYATRGLLAPSPTLPRKSPGEGVCAEGASGAIPLPRALCGGGMGRGPLFRTASRGSEAGDGAGLRRADLSEPESPSGMRPVPRPLGAPADGRSGCRPMAVVVCVQSGLTRFPASHRADRPWRAAGREFRTLEKLLAGA